MYDLGLAVTPLLPYDATDVAMKAALELLHGISRVDVSREGPDDQGGYRWHIVFHETSLVIPLLGVHTEALHPHGYVSIERTQSLSAVCTETCNAVVDRLESQKKYHVRLRAQNEDVISYYISIYLSNLYPRIGRSNDGGMRMIATIEPQYPGRMCPNDPSSTVSIYHVYL